MADEKGYPASGEDSPKLKNDAAIAQSDGSDDIADYGINEKVLVRKLDIRLLPGIIILYLLSFLDRSNVANARVEGLTTDIKMTGNQYLTGLTLFFIGYILFEVPWYIILKRTSPKLWLPTITLVWGVVATLQGIVQSLAGFFIVRFFLGVTEGGLFPGVIFYLSFWYPRLERQYRVALFFSAASLAGAFGGILAWAIAKMDGIAGLGGWRWIFILEGIFTCVVAVFGYLFITNYPETARFLSEKEKLFIQRRLQADNDATPDERFTWHNVLAALKDYKVWLYCAAFHTMSLPLYTLSLFLPTIIKSLGYSSAQAQLLTVPPYALATILTVIVAYLNQRLPHRRALLAALSSSLAVIGYIILLANNGHYFKTTYPKSAVTGLPTKTKTPYYDHPGISYLGTFFAAAGIYPATALALGWPAVNVSGATKRAVACGLQITVGNLGAVMGTQLYRSEDTPTFYVGHAMALSYLVGNVLVSGVIWWVLRRENARREQAAAGSGGEELEGKWKGDVDVRWRFQT